MGRRKQIDRPVEKRVSIPESLVASIDLRLFSEIEGRVPHGAWSMYVSNLIRNDQARFQAKGGLGE